MDATVLRESKKKKKNITTIYLNVVLFGLQYEVTFMDFI